MQIPFFSRIGFDLPVRSLSLAVTHTRSSDDYDERGVIRLPVPPPASVSSVSTANLLLRSGIPNGDGRGRSIHMNSPFLTYIISQGQMFCP